MAHLNLDIANLALRQLDKLELAEQGVPGGHGVISSVHHHAHLALVAVHSSEGLLGSAGGGHGVWNELVQLVPNHGNTQGRPPGWQRPALEGVLVCCGACMQPSASRPGKLLDWW